jgi:hypothetical protein
VLKLRNCRQDAMNRLDFDEDEQAAADFDWTMSSSQFPVDQVADFSSTLKATPALGVARLPDVQPDQLNEEQRRVFDFVRDRLQHFARSGRHW